MDLTSTQLWALWWIGIIIMIISVVGFDELKYFRFLTNKRFWLWFIGYFIGLYGYTFFNFTLQ